VFIVRVLKSKKKNVSKTGYFLPSPDLRTEIDAVSETLCSLVFRIPYD
jgi:hypothetical protein